MKHIPHFFVFCFVIFMQFTLLNCGSDPAEAISLDFDGTINRKVLSSYLSLAVTHAGICDISEGSTLMFNEDLRMLTNTGAKFIGSASFLWSPYDNIEWHFTQSSERAAAVHAADPQIILQACIFECISSQTINQISVPDWVFEAFDLPVSSRNFSYDNMLFTDNSYVGYWGENLSVPDITKIESRMWVYYLAVRYIDAGFESLHFGQVDLSGSTDKLNNWEAWDDILTKIRTYAQNHARRHLVLCD